MHVSRRDVVYVCVSTFLGIVVGLARSEAHHRPVFKQSNGAVGSLHPVRWGKPPSSRGDACESFGHIPT